MRKLSECELQQLFEQSLPHQPIPLDLRQRVHQRVQSELKNIQRQARLQQRGYYEGAEGEFENPLLAQVVQEQRYSSLGTGPYLRSSYSSL